MNPCLDLNANTLANIPIVQSEKKNTCIIECEHMVCSFNIRRSNYENEFV